MMLLGDGLVKVAAEPSAVLGPFSTVVVRCSCIPYTLSKGRVFNPHRGHYAFICYFAESFMRIS